MAKVYLGLGTNLGDKEQNLRDAVQKIEEQVGKIVSLSAFYITAPWGFSSDNSFLNAAVCVDTELAPIDVLQRTQAIEQKLGRTKKSVNGIYSDRLIQFHYEGIFEEILDQLGEMPLPPYITHKLKDKNRYQTVYAKNEGSAAAPTAGLHFTKELLEKVKEKGVNIAHVTLHVGLGTFRPVKVDDVESHHMHSEFYIVEEDQAKLINDTKKAGKRVISVGTTSCRTLESATGEDGILRSGSGWTEIFIYPGYKFKMIDGLITNFHLPESTLLMLVSALAGKENIMRAYETAVQERYRFFSFGDAMIII